MKKILSLVLCLMMLLTVSAFAEPTASELIKDAFTGKTYDSFKANGLFNVSAKMSTSDNSMSFDVPLECNADFDYSNKIIHGTLTLKGNVIGEDLDENIELYADVNDMNNSVVYVNVNGEGWFISNESQIKDLAGDAAASMDSSSINSESLDIEKLDAAAAVTEVDGGYNVNIPFAYFADIADEAGAEESIDEIAGEYADLAKQILESLEKMSISLDFDNEGYFSGMHLLDCRIVANTEVQGVVMNMDIKIEADAFLNNINGVDAFAIPQEVIDNAQPIEMN